MVIPNGESGRRGPRRIISVDLVIGVIALLAILFMLGYPLFAILKATFYLDGHVTLLAFRRTLAQPGLFRLFFDTSITIVGSALFALLAGGMLAWVNERTDAGLGLLSAGIPLISLVVPLIAGAVGWTFLLSSRVGFANVIIRNLLSLVGIHMSFGPLNIFTWPGLILAYGTALTPFAYLPMSAAFASLDDSLEEASRIAGARGLRTLTRITFPAIAPAILSAAAIVVVIGLAQYAVPVVVATGANIPILTVRIVQLLTASFPPQTGVAIVLGLFLAVAISGITALQLALTRRGNFAHIGGKGSSHKMIRLGAWRWPARLAMIFFLCLMSLVPVICIVIVSLQPFFSPNLNHLSFVNYQKLFDPQSLDFAIMVRTLKLAFISGCGCVAVAGGIALAARHKNSRFGRFIAVIPVLPAMLSQPVLATGLILAFAGDPFHLAGTSTILVIAYIIVFLPQAYYGVTAAISQVGNDLLEASAVSGARGFRTLLRIMLPLSAQGLYNAWAIVVALVITDVTIPALLAGTNNAVMGYQILNLYQGGTFPQLAALSVMSMVIAALLLIVFSAAIRRLRY